MLSGPLAHASEQVSDRFAGVCDQLATFYRASAVAASPVLATIMMSVRPSVRPSVRHTLTLCENDAS